MTRNAYTEEYAIDMFLDTWEDTIRAMVVIAAREIALGEALADSGIYYDDDADPVTCWQWIWEQIPNPWYFLALVA